jgi:hypothetical protein
VCGLFLAAFDTMGTVSHKNWILATGLRDR